MPLTDPALSLDALAESDDTEPIDVETARLMRRLGAEATVQHAALLLSAQRRGGAACIRLRTWAGRPFPEADGPPLPPLADWRAALDASDLVGTAHAQRAGAEPTPLVHDEDGGRLYLFRWWQAEQTVARLLRQRLAGADRPTPEAARAAFASLFAVKSGHEPAAGQAVAAAAALCSPLTVVTGGPGTGKTYAAARLLALLAQVRPGLDVALAAPTGKAAKRLGTSIARELDGLDHLPSAARQSVPRHAQTLHRLLGYQPRTDRFRFHAGRPLDVDAVLVDESSMIDLLLFEALLKALPEHARLVFLGDAHQLASVDAGRVLADLSALGGTGRSPRFARFCRQIGAGAVPVRAPSRSTGGSDDAAPIDPSPLRDAAVALRKNYRFGAGSGIAALARAVRTGDAEGALDVLADDAFPEVRRVDPPSAPGDVLRDALDHARALCHAGIAEEALSLKGRFQVLAAVYGGPWGVRAANDFVERALLKDGTRTAGRFYSGRLVLVTKNDYDQDLFNGDLGVCASVGGRLRACFESGGEAETPRAVPLSRLPGHQSAWAVTVHKSQGSEYDEVLLLLPAEMRPPLCRELVYTAATRARERVTIVGRESILRRAIAAPERRASGLPATIRHA